MGTRNITRVISDNELKVCQYCQWDGYPTGAGRDIIDFIRSSDDDRMVERLSHVNLDKVTEEGARVFFTGAPMFPEAQPISNDEWEFRREADRNIRREFPDHSLGEWYELTNARVKKMLLDKYGDELMLRYELSIRDTGWKVLSIVYGSDDDLTLWTDDYLTDNFGDWQIEAVWELDYDARKLTGWWRGHKWSWTFARLRQMDDNDVYGVMYDYENIDEED